MQSLKFWTGTRLGLWRAAIKAGRGIERVIIGFVIFILVLAGAEVAHKPILADHVPPHHFIPAAHAK
jgi:hypothetical protein